MEPINTFHSRLVRLKPKPEATYKFVISLTFKAVMQAIEKEDPLFQWSFNVILNAI